MSDDGTDYRDGSAYFGSPERVRAFMETHEKIHGNGVTMRIRVSATWLAENAETYPAMVESQIEHVISRDVFPELNKFERTRRNP